MLLYKVRTNRVLLDNYSKLMTARTAGGSGLPASGGGLPADGGKRQGREVPQSLRVKPGAKQPVWKTQSTRRNTY